MNVVIHSNESLVFRDGRPFGAEGQVNGGALRWPHASTVVGLLRTRIGLSRSQDYFSGENKHKNINEIKKVGATRILPLWQGIKDGSDWLPLFPAPADAMTFPGSRENHYLVKPFTYENAFAEGGIDLPWKNWLLPISTNREKPASDPPELWHKKSFFTWLETGSLTGEVSAHELGLNLPLPELRIHTAIDPATGGAKTSQLFSSQGIQLNTAAGDRQSAGRFGIGANLTQLNQGDDPCGPCFFGGERKTARIEKIKDFLPPIPDWFQTPSRFLRLILITPGDFNTWVPEWLEPDWNQNETNWCTIPNTSLQIRLVSALIPRWFPVSGWDYETRGPKATRKLVPAGAVYIVELKDPEKTNEVANCLWGRSLNSDLSDPNGAGCVCVGKLTI